MKNKPYKPQTLFIDSGTYPFSVLCFVNQNNKAVEKKLSKYFDKQTIIATTILNTNKATTAYIPASRNLIVRFVDLNKNSFPIIAHEMFHVTEFLFDIIGLKYDPITSSEAFSYQLEYFCKALLTALK